MGEGFTGGASDIVKAKSSGEDPRATRGLVSNLPHPRVNKTKQHTSGPHCLSLANYNTNADNDASNHMWIMTKSANASARAREQTIAKAKARAEGTARNRERARARV